MMRSLEAGNEAGKVMCESILLLLTRVLRLSGSHRTLKMLFGFDMKILGQFYVPTQISPILEMRLKYGHYQKAVF